MVDQVLKSTCGQCFSGCGVLVHLSEGKIIKVTGDPDSPVNKKALCPKGLAALEYLHHPDRLRYPLKRIGAKGAGEWQQVSWQEALDIVADKFNLLKSKYGSESIVFVQGAAKGLVDTYNERLANAFGSPNLSTTGHICFLPRLLASRLTCGFYPVPDYQGSPACIVVWGANLSSTRLGEHLKTVQQLQRGTELLVIDPVQTGLARKARLWLQLRPGSDLLLALGMTNVIINENLYDKAFVDNWCTGFEQLKRHVSKHDPAKVAELTWVPESKIIEAARVYATTKPASIQWGNAIDQGVNSFQTARALTILRAITGNLGVYGGDLEPSYPLASMDFALRDKLTTEIWNKRVSASSHLLPVFFRVLPQHLIKAILEKDPYPVRAMYVHGSNPLLTFSNAKETYRALNQLEFLVVADRFMTPTATLADIVLPVATYLEFDSIVAPPYYPVAQVQQKAVEIDECWSDYRIVNELAKRLGLGHHFWDNLEDFFDLILKQAGLTFEEFRKVGSITGIRREKRYESAGFATPSGKVELYSSQLEEWGFDPLPMYIEPPETPFSNRELVEKYPLILTNFKSRFYWHSSGRQVQNLRDKHPDPEVIIHPRTAGRLSIRDGDWVVIETRRGKIKQRASVKAVVDPRVVVADFGWWFPENHPSTLFGWQTSNLNILTDDKPPYNREIGSNHLRGLLCRIYPSTPESPLRSGAKQSESPGMNFIYQKS